MKKFKFPIDLSMLTEEEINQFREDPSTIERKSEPCFVWGTIFVQTKRHSLP